MTKLAIHLLLVMISAASAGLIAQVPETSKAVAGAERAVGKAAKANAAPAPGCAVGVSLNGQSIFEKAFGLAEMEHNITNTPQTIFESGSVAKQFTAAAVVLLSLEGKLKLDDSVKKYVPELPDYGAPLTIRHMLNHTAGLRDWGSVMALTGVGRGDRVVNQDLALDIIKHQKGLDFTPGAEYSYSNSGYNLAAIIVERVSKQKFADFMAERVFKPLGMKSSSTRDDYRRVVPGRAHAYSRDSSGQWVLNMPFMNVYGNGGMLTTVGDWLKWNAMLDARSIGAPLVDTLETQGVLNDRRKISYALGLEQTNYHGIKEISHGGSTAGYQTFLARFPEKKLSVAVMCNGTSPSAAAVTYSIVDEIFGPFIPQTSPDGITLPEEQLTKLVGIYRNEKTHQPTRITLDKGVLRFQGTSPLKPMPDGTFMLGTVKLTLIKDKDGRTAAIEAVNPAGDVTRLIAGSQWTPSAADLQEFAGDWYSEESGSIFSFTTEADKAFFVQRPATKLQLRPLFKDHFAGQGSVMWFTRDNAGKVDKLHVGASRVRDIVFERVRR